MPDAKRPQVTIKGSAVLDSIRGIQARLGDEAYTRLVGSLDEEARRMFQGDILPTSWYPLDAFVRFLEADLRDSAGGDERALVARSRWLFEKQLKGIYRLFVKLGSPEFVLKRISIVHMTYYNGVHLQTVSLDPGRAVLRYVGFDARHRVIGNAIIGFYGKALELSGAKDVRAEFTTPIGDPKGYAELLVTWS